MDFFVNRGSTYSEIIMELVKDNQNDYTNFFQDLENATIRFKMVNVDTGLLKVPFEVAECVVINDDEMGLKYKFKHQDINAPGTYEGKFIIQFVDNSEQLIVPIKDKLLIHVKL